jgi:hypothetical protein
MLVGEKFVVSHSLKCRVDDTKIAIHHVVVVVIIVIKIAQKVHRQQAVGHHEIVEVVHDHHLPHLIPVRLAMELILMMDHQMLFSQCRSKVGRGFSLPYLCC